MPTATGRSWRSTGSSAPIELPVEPPGYTHIYNQFVIRAPRRDALRTHLTSRRIGTEIYYPIPFHRQACFATLGRTSDTFTVAERGSRARRWRCRSTAS